jgi:hypothetical protein
LELLQVERRYEVNAEVLAHMAERGLAAGRREMLTARPVRDPPTRGVHSPGCNVLNLTRPQLISIYVKVEL